MRPINSISRSLVLAAAITAALAATMTATPSATHAMCAAPPPYFGYWRNIEEGGIIKTIRLAQGQCNDTGGPQLWGPERIVTFEASDNSIAQWKDFKVKNDYNNGNAIGYFSISTRSGSTYQFELRRVDSGEREGQLRVSWQGGNVESRVDYFIPTDDNGNPMPIKKSAKVFMNVDLPGMDFANFPLPRSDYRLCQQACLKDSDCHAWTYVKPNTIQGPRPYCWLKDGVPAAVDNRATISGTR